MTKGRVAAGTKLGIIGLERIRGMRCNGSRMSHAELDETEQLDSEETDVFAAQVVALRTDNPKVTRHATIDHGCAIVN
jgi:hypothetical protein